MANRRSRPLREFLEEISRTELTDWILAAARDLPEFRQRLEFFAAIQSNPEEGLELIEKVSQELACLAARPHGSVRVAEITPHGAFLLESIEKLLQRGRLIDAFHYCGKCAWLLDMAMTRLPNQSVRMNRLLEAFESLHFRIASQRPVDPATLGERLFTLQLNSAHNFLLNCLSQYQALLGETGLSAYRKNLDRAYRILVHGEPVPETAGNQLPTHLQEAKLLRAWGEFTPNLAERFSIAMAFARNQTEVLEIAARMEACGKHLDAVDAVLAACDRLHNPPPVSLFTYLASYFEADGNFERSLEFRWEIYRAQPNESSYRKLIAAAAPLRQTSEVRNEALELAAAKNNSLYTRLLLLEGRREEALDQARAHGATTEVWAMLAESYAQSEPHTAIHLYFDCAKYSLRTLRKANYYERSSEYMGAAWKLATNVQTFQTFSVRLKKFFEQNPNTNRLREAVANAGVPLQDLLKN
jgi:hypothetical protein